MENIFVKLKILSLILAVSSGANILGFFPTPSISHQIVFHGLMKELATRGHKLTIITTDVIKDLVNNSNVTQIDLHFSYKNIQEKLNFVNYKNKKMNEVELMDFFFPIMMNIFEDQLNHPEVQKLINERENYKFDAFIFEYLMYYSLTTFGEIFDCPVIGITSLDAPRKNHEIIGNEANPVTHPELIFPYVNQRSNFLDRWKILKYTLNEYFYQDTKWEERHMKIVQRYFSNISIKNNYELMSKVDFLMVNAHPALGFIRPITPKTIQLGFMHIDPPKELPKGDLKNFVETAKNGVIYMSFGSNVRSKDLDFKVQNIFLNTFRNLDYKFIWKFEDENIQNKPSNVLISKWLPQSDLLAHQNVKLFITQGGQQSMEEAIERGVPLIVIPFFGDQNVNAIRMKQKKIGYPLEFHDLTEEKLREAILEMLNPKYKENILKLRELIHDEPMTSRQKAAWWTEYVIRHKGTKHLDYPVKDVPFYEKYFIDFIAFAVIIFLITFRILVKVLNFLFLTKKLKIKSQ